MWRASLWSSSSGEFKFHLLFGCEYCGHLALHYQNFWEHICKLSCTGLAVDMKTYNIYHYNMAHVKRFTYMAGWNVKMQIWDSLLWKMKTAWNSQWRCSMDLSHISLIHCNVLHLPIISKAASSSSRVSSLASSLAGRGRENQLCLLRRQNHWNYERTSNMRWKGTWLKRSNITKQFKWMQIQVNI